MPESIIEIIGLKKYFVVGDSTINALRGINTKIDEGEFVVVFGPSGCGKTTLLSMLGGLDIPSAGTVVVKGSDLYKLKQTELARYRRTRVGMVFQQFNLVPILNARENVALPLVLAGISGGEADQRAVDLLKLVGMGNRLDHKPSELSGGQQQRIAIARALVANPSILFVDEPTGNLDIPTGNEIMALLKEINHKWKRTIVLVTHNPDFLNTGDRVLYMEDGQIVKDQKNNKTNEPDSQSKGEVKFFSARLTGGMKAASAFRLSWAHFWSRKLRTFLTMLGVALGVGSIVTLVSLGVGLQKITSDQLASLDALVTINVTTSKDSIKKLDDQAVADIGKISDVLLVSPAVATPAKITLDDSTAQVIADAVKPEALDFEGVSLISGSKYSNESGIIISKATAKNFNVNDMSSVIGKKVIVNIVQIPDNATDLSSFKNIQLDETITGVSSDETLSSVYISLSAIQKALSINSYNSIKVKVNDRKNVAAARDKIEKLGFSTTSVVDLINQVDRIFLITQIMLGVIGGVALIVALIGIVNIMTISLLERTHEVGVMKAIGATNLDIRRIFEYEVILFGFFGAAFGVGGAWLFGSGVNTFISILMRMGDIGGSLTIFVTPTFFALEMVILTVLVALLAGLYPAKRASKLSPMEALRYE